MTRLSSWQDAKVVDVAVCAVNPVAENVMVWKPMVGQIRTVSPTTVPDGMVTLSVAELVPVVTADEPARRVATSASLPV